MEITETLYVTDRDTWRAWLAEYHATATEIWLIYPKKATGKPGIPYDHAVEEALCYGWIDSLEKSLDTERLAQRFTPRRPKSNWTELNKERARRLIAAGKMESAGQAVLPDLTPIPLVIPADIQAALEVEPPAWENFQNFPEYYQRIRIQAIEEVRKQPETYQQRLALLVKHTARNRMFGSVL